MFSGYPNVLTIHGNMRRVARVRKAQPFSFLWLAARLERLTIPRSQGVVCITRHTQEAVWSLAQHTWVVPNAVDAAFFDLDAQPPPGAPARILCVGDVYALKNQNALIRALDPLAESRKFEVLFLGKARAEEPYAAEFFRLVKARPWCGYGGFASREELKAICARRHFWRCPPSRRIVPWPCSKPWRPGCRWSQPESVACRI